MQWTLINLSVLLDRIRKKFAMIRRIRSIKDGFKTWESNLPCCPLCDAPKKLILIGVKQNF